MSQDHLGKEAREQIQLVYTRGHNHVTILYPKLPPEKEKVSVDVCSVVYHSPRVPQVLSAEVR